MTTIPLSALNSGQSIFSPAVQIFSVANNVAWDLDIAQNAFLHMTEDTTISAPTHMSGKAGKWCFLQITQGGATPYNLYYDAVFTNGGTLPPISTALNAVDGLLLYCTGTTMQVWLSPQNIGS